MKRLLAGAALLTLGLMASTETRADGWSDSFSDSHSYASLGSSMDRVGKVRGDRAGRANLGAMSDDDDEPVRRGRSARRSGDDSRRTRLARANYTADDGEPSSYTRRSHSSRTASGGYSGGGMASYYWQGQRVASGGRFNPNAMTAAHRTLPFGTRVRVTNRSNGRSAVVTINDRGPFVAGRVIDLSRAAAGAIGMIGAGVARVSLEVIGR